MEIKLAHKINTDSIVDGEGLRTVIWTQGCSHNCPGCHNPETHDFNAGFSIDIDKLKEEIMSLEYQDGITFSGGDPFFQAEACAILAKFIKALNLNIWCYTGFKFEKLLELSKSNKYIKEFLNNIDVLVDGPFILEQRSLNLKYKGSLNQRIIDVQESFKKNEIVIIEKYNTIKTYEPLYKKKEYLYA